MPCNPVTLCRVLRTYYRPVARPICERGEKEPAISNYSYTFLELSHNWQAQEITEANVYIGQNQGAFLPPMLGKPGPVEALWHHC
jgi:hypothetical protein